MKYQSCVLYDNNTFHGTNLQKFWCIACSPLQPQFTYQVNSSMKVIKVCPSFAAKLFPLGRILHSTDLTYTDDTGKGTKYDECGLRVANDCPSECAFDSCGDSVVTPSVSYANAVAFMNGVRPTFFTDTTQYVFEVADSDGPGCFSSSATTHSGIFIASLLISILVIWF
jgi:hypothetical protein